MASQRDGGVSWSSTTDCRVVVSGVHFAIIDKEDAPAVLGHKWTLSGRCYAARCSAGITTYMHRLISGAAPGQYVDHINHNTLDNRRHNLRLCTCSQNHANRRPTRRFKGVSRVSAGWGAWLQVDKHNRKLGVFDTEEEAATAYDFHARVAFGDYALVNFPDRYELPLTTRQKLVESGGRCPVCGAHFQIEKIGIARVFCSNRCGAVARRRHA
jgi:hypothetical protein